jgi:hypothetical protein
MKTGLENIVRMETLVKGLNICRDKQLGEEELREKGSGQSTSNGTRLQPAEAAPVPSNNTELQNPPITALVEVEGEPCFEHRRALEAFIELAAPLPVETQDAKVDPKAGESGDHVGVTADIALMRNRVNLAKADASGKKDACNTAASATHEVAVAGHEKTRSHLVGDANNQYSSAAATVSDAFASKVAAAVALASNATRDFASATEKLDGVRGKAEETNATFFASLASQEAGTAEAKALQNATVVSAAEAMATSNRQAARVQNQSSVGAAEAMQVRGDVRMSVEVVNVNE